MEKRVESNNRGKGEFPPKKIYDAERDMVVSNTSENHKNRLGGGELLYTKKQALNPSERQKQLREDTELLKGRAAQLKEREAQLKERDEQLKGRKAPLNERAAQLKERAAQLKEREAQLKERKAQFRTQREAIQSETFSSADDRYPRLSSELQQLVRDRESIHRGQAALEAFASTTSQSLGGAEQNFLGGTWGQRAETVYSNTERDLRGALQEAVADYSARVNDHKGRREQELSEHSETVDQYQTEKAKHKKAVDQHNTEMAAHEEDLAQHKTEVAKHKEERAQYQTEMAKYKEERAQYQIEITQRTAKRDLGDQEIDQSPGGDTEGPSFKRQKRSEEDS